MEVIVNGVSDLAIKSWPSKLMQLRKAYGRGMPPALKGGAPIDFYEEIAVLISKNALTLRCNRVLRNAAPRGTPT